ncbi:hypothetical protein G9A89_008245 [Geosiphon pyriformis]|nr:hypothetical protein G9A89_008245 [Geosiphon pyriformis]
MQFLACALAFYLWYATLKLDLKIEENCFWYATCGIWVLNAMLQAFIWASAHSRPHWGVVANALYCQGAGDWLAFSIPTIIVSVIAAFFACHSSLLTITRWRQFTQKQSRGTAIQLGLAVRLCVCSLLYAAILLASYVPRVIKQMNNIPDPNQITLAEFSGSCAGTILFLIFGTTRSAAVFLPCCYYTPPDTRRKNVLSFNNPFASQQKKLETIVYLPKD